MFLFTDVSCLKAFGVSELGKLWNSLLTIGTQRTCNVFRFVHSGCKGCDGAICMCDFFCGCCLMPPLLEFVPQRLSVRIPNLCCCVFDPCWLVVLHFGRRYFVFGHPCSAQTDQPHQVVWSRIGDILVIVIDHRLMCELPRSCCKQECGDVGISTPNTLQCMHCYTTAPHGLVWFGVRTRRFWRMFFLPNFLTHCSHLLLDMSLTHSIGI